MCHCEFQASEKSCFFCSVVHKEDEEKGETAKEKSSPPKPMPPAKPKASQELSLEISTVFSQRNLRWAGREERGVPH